MPSQATLLPYWTLGSQEEATFVPKKIFHTTFPQIFLTAACLTFADSSLIPSNSSSVALCTRFRMLNHWLRKQKYTIDIKIVSIYYYASITWQNKQRKTYFQSFVLSAITWYVLFSVIILKPFSFTPSSTMRLQKHIDNHEMIYPSIKKRIIDHLNCIVA